MILHTLKSQVNYGHGLKRQQSIWNHRNGCVFDGAAPSLAGALILASEDRRLWSMAGARGLSFLTVLLPGN